MVIEIICKNINQQDICIITAGKFDADLKLKILLIVISMTAFYIGIS